MKQQYEALFTPWKIRDLEIKNRIVLAPMGGTCIFGWMEPLGSHFDREAAKLLLNIVSSVKMGASSVSRRNILNSGRL